MTDAPAAIKGTFTKLTAVSTRKVAVLSVEVPIEKANEVMSYLGGFPDPANPEWVAVALLDLSASPEAATVQEQAPSTQAGRLWPRRAADPEPGKPKGGRLSQQAGIACNDPRFQTFMRERSKNPESALPPADAAACEVYIYCGISSRAELDHDEGAAARWDALHAEFLADGGLGQ